MTSGQNSNHRLETTVYIPSEENEGKFKALGLDIFPRVLQGDGTKGGAILLHFSLWREPPEAPLASSGWVGVFHVKGWRPEIKSEKSTYT